MGKVIEGSFGSSTFRSDFLRGDTSVTAKSQPTAAGSAATPPDPITGGMTQLAEISQMAQSAMQAAQDHQGAFEPTAIASIQRNFAEIQQALEQLRTRVNAQSAEAALLAWQRDIQHLYGDVAAFRDAIANSTGGAKAAMFSPETKKALLWSGIGIVAFAAIIGGTVWLSRYMAKTQKSQARRRRTAFAGLAAR